MAKFLRKTAVSLPQNHLKEVIEISVLTDRRLLGPVVASHRAHSVAYLVACLHVEKVL